MAGYTLERHGTITLPLYNREIEYSAIPARTGVIDTLAGAYDSYGTEDSDQQFPYDLSFRALVLEDTLAAWRTTLDALRAQVRKRRKLYRRGEDDDAIQFCSARLINADMRRRTGNVLNIEVSLIFQVLTPWVGHDYSTWTFDSGELFDDGLYFDEAGFTETLTGGDTDIVVTNGGNRRVDNAVITITAGDAAITALTISKAGETDIDYSGNIATTKSLVIDCGAHSVEDDGTSDYDNFDLASGHVIADWLYLDPGDNTINIVYTGGGTGGTVTIEFQDGWA